MNIRHITCLALSFGLLFSTPAAHAQTDSESAPSFFTQSNRMALPARSSPERLRFVTTLDFPPFNSLNEAGQLSGYNIDLAKALCNQMGLENVCQIEALPWDELVDRVKSGEADAIIAGLSPNEANRNDFSFTHSYMRLPARFVTLRGKSFNTPAARALAGKTVGVLEKTAHEQLLKAYFPETRHKSYADRASMLEALEKEEVEAVFDDGMTLSFWLNGNDAAECCTFTDGAYLAPQFLGNGLTIATRNEEAALTIAFDNALQALEQKGVLTELYLRYFPVSFY